MKSGYKKLFCITAAVREEISGLKGSVSEKKKVSCSDRSVILGKLAGISVILSLTGVGKHKASAALYGILNQFDVSAILSIGFGGGINPCLTTSDIVLCDPVIGHDKRENTVAYHSDAALLQRALLYVQHNNIPCYRGPSLTVDTIISTVVAKQKINKDYHVFSVDMENSVIADLASERKIPFLMIRSISDSAVDDISFLDRFNGNFSKYAIGMYAAAHPEIIPKLYNLKKKSQKAAQMLAAFVTGFMTSLSSR